MKFIQTDMRKDMWITSLLKMNGKLLINLNMTMHIYIYSEMTLSSSYLQQSYSDLLLNYLIKKLMLPLDILITQMLIHKT